MADRPPVPDLLGPDGECLHENPWFRVMLRRSYYCIEHVHPQVVVLPLVGEDAVLVRVRRPVAGTELLELPAGGVDPGASLVEGARRELAEESGIWVEDLAAFEPLPPLAVTPDRMPTLPHLFQVRLSEAAFEARRPHDDEVVEVVRASPARIRSLAAEGGIRACLPMAMLFRHLCTLPPPVGAHP